MGKRLSVSEFIDHEGVMLDVRSEGEYAKGHIEGAVSFPLFSDQQRAEVGTLYVKHSREAAIERGLEIVGPKMAGFVRKAKELASGGSVRLYCWRGGMRSGSMQWLLETAGLRTVLLTGGYKAYRSDFERLMMSNWKFVVLAGETGSGKSEILREMVSMGEQVLDLEGLANHKGSAFGALGQLEQPTTEEFINRIYNVLRSFDINKNVWVEGESMMIGHVFVPPTLFKKLTSAKTVHFILNRERRLDRIMREYGSFTIEELGAAFERIKKRLGNDNFKLAMEALQEGDVKKAADIGLVYYDKGYNKSIEKRTSIELIRVESDIDEAKDNALKIIELCK